MDTVTLDEIESSLVRCPDPIASEKMAECIDQARREGDSLGGIIESVSRNVPVGLGEPVFDKLKADLAKAMMSLPCDDGLPNRFRLWRCGWHRFGAQRSLSTTMTGAFVHARIIPAGTQGGHLKRRKYCFSDRFQADRYHSQGAGNGRSATGTLSRYRRMDGHDPCVLPRAPAIIEAMTALVLVDHFLRQRAKTLD